MKTLLFCNLIPLKTGAYEVLLAAIGAEFRKTGDEFVVVFAGEPIEPVAEALRAAGVRWQILSEWTEKGQSPQTQGQGEEKKFEQKLTKITKGGNGFSAGMPAGVAANSRTQEGGGEDNSSLRASCASVQTLDSGFGSGQGDEKSVQTPGFMPGGAGEKVRPWGFVLPAWRLIRREQPDVVAVHFGNELPTLAASLLCRLMGWCSRLFSLLTTQQLNNSATFRPPRWVWEQDQQIQDPGRLSRWFSKIRLLGLGVDQYLAVYEGGRQSMLKRGIPAEKITVIHNSVAPYTPTRPKGWLRQELGSEQLAVSSEQGSEKKSNAQVAADVPAAEIESAEKEKSFAGTSNATLRNASHVSPSPAEVLLVTNGSLIPRKRIDFILKACALLQEEKRLEQPPSPRLQRPGKPAKAAKGEVGDAYSENTHAVDFEMHPTAGEAYTPQPPLRSSRASVQNLNSANWRLLIIGEGPERERLAALTADLGIADRVHFLGLRNDVREILSECDIYVHASKAETCTYAVTESMAAGIPAVMLNAGAAKEQIEQGATGYVHDEVDPISFSVCLGDLMVEPVRRGEMGRLAQSRWEALFRVERAAVRYHDMYAIMA